MAGADQSVAVPLELAREPVFLIVLRGEDGAVG